MDQREMRKKCATLLKVSSGMDQDDMLGQLQQPVYLPMMRAVLTELDGQESEDLMEMAGTAAGVMLEHAGALCCWARELLNHCSREHADMRRKAEFLEMQIAAANKDPAVAGEVVDHG